MSYVGEIRMFGGNFAPLGWAFCNGQVLPIAGNETLFQLIGTTYGGDGEETFALPDLRGRLPVHQSTAVGGLIIGETGGVEEVTLSGNQVPPHTHAPVAVDGAPGNQASPANHLPAISLNVTPYLNDATTGAFNGAAVAPVGGSQPHTNLQPFLAISFIIALEGLFPSPT